MDIRKGLILLLIVFVMVGSVIAIFREPHNLQIDKGDLLRLHVIANSDTDEDQALKYEVRDKLVEYLHTILSSATTKQQAYEIMTQHAGAIKNIAEHVVRQKGYAYAVDIHLGKFDFPIKAYGQSVLPAGQYDAVKVTIGEATGANWWCVLFPPLCIVEAGNNANSTNEKPVNNQSVQIKFKLIELLTNK